MLKSDLSYQYPEHLVATERKPVSRVMMVQGGYPSEVTLSHILTEIAPDDLLVINETRVLPARIFSQEGLEVLFIKNEGELCWQVLTPSRRWPKDRRLQLPGGVSATLVEGGLPQYVELSEPITPEYFDKYGDVPLPPYIHEARGEKRSRPSDRHAYQTSWAQIVGSLAAPTASLHFSEKDLDRVVNRGGQVKKLCLHVGLGTFLPIHSSSLDEHKMHSEWVQIPEDTWQAVNECKENGGRVWCLGSTVTRALESAARGDLSEVDGGLQGETDLFIRPGFEYKVTDVLMTNFHQPESTLLAMVMAFAGVEPVRECYAWAIERQFRLFSYGDLSVWKK
jgi:S-adenosylmethionine:tRNA ribosyltransferase-isomerase